MVHHAVKFQVYIFGCIGPHLGYMFIWYCRHGSLASAPFGQRCVPAGYGLILIPLDGGFLIQKGIFAESMFALPIRWCLGTLFLPEQTYRVTIIDNIVFVFYHVNVWELLIDWIAHAHNLIHVIIYTHKSTTLEKGIIYSFVHDACMCQT